MKGFVKYAIVAVAVIALAGAAAGFVQAQDGGSDEAGERPDFVARLAENLGITEEELRAAIQETQIEVLDERLEAGLITQEQYDRLRERIESGEGPGFGPGHGPGRCAAGLHALDGVAEFLGLERGELIGELQSGSSLAQIAEEQGVSVEDLKAFLLGNIEERVQQALDDGRIDQEQADRILARAEERVDELVNKEGPFNCGRHRFGGPGMEGGADPAFAPEF